jgi:sugar-specific transcriptional regulator TrmB
MQQETRIPDTLYKILPELGLSEIEVKLYALSLSRGPSLVSALAENIGLSRPNVYKVIAGLEKKGFAQFSEQKGYKRRFMVESPSRVVELFREKQKNLVSLDQNMTLAMPDLLALWKQGSLPTKVTILQGREQYLKLFDMIIDEAQDDVKFFGSIQDFVDFISESEERRWIKRRLKRNLPMKTLLLPSKEADRLGKNDKKELRETRILKEWPPLSSSFELFANKAIVWQPKAPLAVLVEDEYVVAMLKSIFDHLWNEASRM